MIGFSLVYISIAVIASARVEETVVLVNAGLVIVLAIAVAFVRSRSDRKAAQILHAFYVVPLVLLLFKTSEYLSYPIHGKDYDESLILIDRMLFGVDPTIWLYETLPIVPFFIEYLQICYSLFYMLPVWVAVELYRRRISRDPLHHFHDDELDELEQHRFVIVYGFCLSYLGYVLYPAIGPRFFLHDFWSISREMPGLYLTEALRTLTNSGENVEPWMTHAEAMKVVTRDAFPSGHTMMTLVTIVMAFRFKVQSRVAILVIGSSLIFATVYLRYHYVADLVGGAVFAAFVLYTWKPLNNLLERIHQRFLLR